VATTTPDGSPHLAAVWGLWLDNAFHFSTGGRSRKARNLAADPRCVVIPDHAEESVVVEGVAERTTDPEALAILLATYQRKYDSGFPDPVHNPVFAVHPRIVFGIIEREAKFSRTATRWVFATAIQRWLAALTRAPAPSATTGLHHGPPCATLG
jgi:hypothetical protein